ncbi:hypothetical protein LCM4577_31360 [Mesorhizobium sp. LCM 4577]|nr:hypothetical protein LCM4577_31360 [Mesorhizobium sp. LCM 4577]
MRRSAKPCWSTFVRWQGPISLPPLDSRCFVKQSKGHVKLYSEVGEGTTVKIYLPRLLSEASIEDAPEVLPVPEAATGETILVVEDDFDVRAYTVNL